MHIQSQRETVEKDLQFQLNEYARQSVMIKKDKEDLLKKLQSVEKQTID